MNQKKHFYMPAISCTYRRAHETVPAGDETGIPEITYTQHERKMNIVIESNKKMVTYADLNSARKGVITRMIEELKLDASDILDIVFLSIPYLGLMSDSDFQGIKSSGPENVFNN